MWQFSTGCTPNLTKWQRCKSNRNWTISLWTATPLFGVYIQYGLQCCQTLFGNSPLIFHFVVLLASVRISWQSRYYLSSMSFSNPDVQSLLLYNFLALLIPSFNFQISTMSVFSWWCQSLKYNRQWTFTQREGMTTVQLCAICVTHSLAVWPSTFTLSQT